MEEIDLKELFNIFWSKKLQIILVVFIFMILGGVYSVGLKTPLYSSSTSLVLAMADTSEKSRDGENAITATDITLNSKLVSTYSELIKSKKVLRQVISNLKIDEEADSLRKKIKVSSVQDTEVIKITVTHENPTYAAKIANEITKVFSKEANELYKINNVYIVDEAEIENAPSNINHIKDVILFALIGLVLSAAYVFILNMLDNTIKSTEDIEKGFDIPVLVTIPLIESFENEKGGNK